MRQSDEMRERTEAASSIALDAGYHIHSLLGPGALEQAYEAFLAEEIRFRGLPVCTQVPIPVSHRGVTLDVAYRIDLLVDEALVIEVKAVRPHPIHHAQLVSPSCPSWTVVAVVSDAVVENCSGSTKDTPTLRAGQALAAAFAKWDATVTGVMA